VIWTRLFTLLMCSAFVLCFLPVFSLCLVAVCKCLRLFTRLSCEVFLQCCCCTVLGACHLNAFELWRCEKVKDSRFRLQCLNEYIFLAEHFLPLPSFLTFKVSLLRISNCHSQSSFKISTISPANITWP
jgi:hypothetical protein